MKIIILGEIPSKKNSKMIICRGARPMVLPSVKYKEWHTEWAYKIASSRPNKPLERCKVEILYYAGTKRKKDLDNANSSILDLLKDTGYILDDNWFVVEEVNSKFMGIDKNPRAEIEIN